MFYPDEVWRKDLNPNLMPIYWVSNFGRVYNELRDCIYPIPPKTYMDNRYIVIDVFGINGERIHKRVHVWVMELFGPYHSDYLNIVNHLNGLKYDNRLDNLEWTDNRGNVRHAFDHGLNLRGEDAPKAKFTNDEVHGMCKRFEMGHAIIDVARDHYHKPFNMMDRAEYNRICNIANGYTWKHISGHYKIDNHKKANRITDEQVHKICKLIQSGDYKNNMDILHKAGVNGSVSIVKLIKRGLLHRDIASQYGIC